MSKMRVAVLSQEWENYEKIKKFLKIEPESCDLYKDFNHLMQYHMLCYDFLVLEKDNRESFKEVQAYCNEKGTQLMLYHNSENDEAIEVVSGKVEECEEIEEDTSPDTIELRPQYYKNNSTEPDTIEVVKTVYSGIVQRNICIGNLSRKAGSTFIALCLAKALSEKNMLTAFIEPPLGEPYIFDYIGLQQRLLVIEDVDDNQYLFIEDILNSIELNNKKEVLLDDILWFVVNPLKSSPVNLDGQKMMQLINTSKRTCVNIIDIGNNWCHPSVIDSLNSFEKILIIIDPLPPDILQKEVLLGNIKNMRDAGYPIEFIVNKYQKGVRMKELVEYLGVTPAMNIPFVDLSYIYKAVYQYKIPYEIPEVKNLLEKEMNLLIKKIIFNGKLKESKKKNIFKIPFQNTPVLKEG